MSFDDDGFDPNADDVAPGVMDAADHSIRAGIQGYLIGLGLAALLTVASFYVAGTHFIWAPSIPVMLVVLAIAQIGVHLVFFLHITTAPDNTNNILALFFGILIVGLIVIGSIWIMSNLNDNLMPMQHAMAMQRWGGGEDGRGRVGDRRVSSDGSTGKCCGATAVPSLAAAT